MRTLPPSQGKTFQGVGAVTLCKAKLEFALDEFQENCEFWVCPNSPALASVGRRCMQQGMSFVWPRNEAPYFVTSWGTVVNLLVFDNIPYLFPGHPACAPIPVTEGHLVIPSPVSHACSACPGQQWSDSLVDVFPWWQDCWDELPEDAAGAATGVGQSDSDEEAPWPCAPWTWSCLSLRQPR